LALAGASFTASASASASASRSFAGTWANSTLTVPLAAGSNTVRVSATASGGVPNLDYPEVG
jgi:uncharacterized protein YcnI